MFFDTGPKPPSREPDPNATKKYYLFCELCGYKHWADNEEDIKLTAIVSAPIPTGVNKSRPQPKKFKCPGCGKGTLKLKPFVPMPLPQDNKFPKLEDNENNKQTQIGF